MTLLIVILAAIICTMIFYFNEKARKMHISTLCFVYWGASLMWSVDAVSEYIGTGAGYFIPSGADMLNDGFLGFSAIALGLLIRLAEVILKDPLHVFKNSPKGK